MRILIQRVTRASVTVAGEPVGAIGRGLLVFVGVTAGDDTADVEYVATKIVNLRIFEDADGAMNLSALDLLQMGDGAVGVLVVSQFTLYADVRKGRRPSFIAAATPTVAAPLVTDLAGRIRSFGLSVAEGRFGAEMAVELVNDGPVTIWMDTADLRGSPKEAAPR